MDVKKKIGNLSFMIIVSLILAFVSYGQSVPKHITLEEAIECAIEENQSFKQTKLDTRIAEAESHSANATFLPQLNLSYNALYTDNPLNAFGFKLQQRIVTPADFDPERLNHPEGISDFSAQLQIQQPLLNLDAIYMRQGARRMLEMKTYSQQRAKEYLIFQVKQAYLQIGLAYKNLSVMDKAVATAKAFEQRVSDMYDEGLVQQADFLEAKSYYLKMLSQRQIAYSNIANTSDQLNLLLGADMGTTYKVDDQEWSASDIAVVDLANRTDLKAFRAGLSAANSQITASKMRFLPRINAFGTYQFNDEKLFHFDQNSYMVGISLSWNLFGGSKNINKLKVARFNQQKIVSQISETEKKAKAEYDKAYRDLRDLSVTMEYAQTMVEQTKEAWRIQKDRYEQGLSPTSDLLRVQTQLAQQELMLEQTIFQHNVTIAYLRLITSK